MYFIAFGFPFLHGYILGLGTKTAVNQLIFSRFFILY